MDVSEYRRRVEAELEKAARDQVSSRDLLAGARASGDEDDLTAALGVLDGPDAEPALRNAALQVVALHVDDRPELFDTLLELLRDTGRPLDERLAVLSTLQQIAIRIVGLPEKRPLYLDALRSLVDDPSAELRRQAIAILAREKDEYVQRRLLDGLEKRSKPLVPAAKAIQLLGYDVHAEHFPLLRRIVEDPPNRAAKIEALRVLAADPSSGDLLLAVMQDTDENPEVRRIAAVALGSAAPDDVQRPARRIALDDGEDDQLRALALTMLSLFADPETLSGDDELNRCVDRLRAESGSRTVKQASAAFIARRG